MGQNKRWSQQREDIFLDRLRQSGNVTAATAEAGLDRAQVYRRRNSNAAFRTKWQNAMDQALDYLEAYLWEKAMGKNSDVTMDSREIDEKIAIFLLKAHRPEIFGDGKKRLEDKSRKKQPSPRAQLIRKLDQMAQKSCDEL